MRTATRTRRATTVATPPALPNGLHPLTWGVWPSADARLAVSGTPGVWAYAGNMECGKQLRFIEIIPWHLRHKGRWAPRGVAPVERVYVEAEASA